MHLPSVFGGGLSTWMLPYTCVVLHVWCTGVVVTLVWTLEQYRQWVQGNIVVPLLRQIHRGYAFRHHMIILYTIHMGQLSWD